MNTLNAAVAAKNDGQDKVQEHCEDFVEFMRSTAKNLALANGSVTSDDLRCVAMRGNLAPNHPNAWGAIFKGRNWKSIGFKRSEFLGNHARTIRIWEYVP